MFIHRHIPIAKWRTCIGWGGKHLTLLVEFVISICSLNSNVTVYICIYIYVCTYVWVYIYIYISKLFISLEQLWNNSIVVTWKHANQNSDTVKSEELLNQVKEFEGYKRALADQHGLSGNSCDSHSRVVRFVSLPGKRISLLMLSCGVPKSLQANTVLVQILNHNRWNSRSLSQLVI